jgi:hypothetical protein
VQAAKVSGATIDAAGGIVQGADGSLVMLPPGALDEASSVSIAALSEPQLPLPVPSEFALQTAFHLDVGSEALHAAAQLAIPVPPSLPAGTNVIFARAGEVPDAAGALHPYWFQV